MSGDRSAISKVAMMKLWSQNSENVRKTRCDVLKTGIAINAVFVFLLVALYALFDGSGKVEVVDLSAMADARINSCLKTGLEALDIVACAAEIDRDPNVSSGVKALVWQRLCSKIGSNVAVISNEKLIPLVGR
ncbi:MAG TPA: hypothetical protein VK196_02660 [Magnetospirillum sp.]|nr:hypothetical protein [Magnetospirillum sp.]